MKMIQPNPTVHVLTKDELLEELKSIPKNTFCEQTIWISTHFPEFATPELRNHPYLCLHNFQPVKEQIIKQLPAIIISTALSKLSHIRDVHCNMEDMLDVFTKEDMIRKVNEDTFKTYKEMMGIDVSKELQEKIYTKTSLNYQIHIQIQNKCFHVENWFDERMVLDVK